MKEIYTSISKKLPAFTLTEIVVATLLSAILIGIVVSAFTFLLDHMQNEAGLMDDIENTFLLESYLVNNATKCDSVKSDNNHLKLYENGVSDYSVEFNDNCIVLHTHEITDTFNLYYSDLRYSFYDTKTELISEVNFNINIGTLHIPMVIAKVYEGLTLVNSKTIWHEN